MRGQRLLGGVPTLLVGVAMAGATEMSASLLLYSSDGFLPALTLILTVESSAFALGLWTGGYTSDREEVDGLRRRWTFVLISFATAAAFSAGMSFWGQFFRGGIGQGLGLAFLGSLPLFALGSLLGGLGGRVGSSLPNPAVHTAVGVALGFLLTGGLLLPNLAPYTYFLVLLTLLSAGAMVHGWVLDRSPLTVVLEEVETRRGLLRVEERGGEEGATSVRVILEGERVRGVERSRDGKGREWEHAVLAALEGEGRTPASALLLGGGSGVMARLLMGAFPDIRVVVLEESEALVRLARKHFLPFPGWDSVQLLAGEGTWALDRLEGPFPLVLVDMEGLPSYGGIPALNRRDWTRLTELAGSAGQVVLGGMGARGALTSPATGEFLRKAREHFPNVVFYQGEEDGFVLLTGPDALPWSPVLPGFHLLPGGEG